MGWLHPSIPSMETIPSLPRCVPSERMSTMHRKQNWLASVVSHLNVTGYSLSKGQSAKVGWSPIRNSIAGGQANHPWDTMVSKDRVRTRVWQMNTLRTRESAWNEVVSNVEKEPAASCVTFFLWGSQPTLSWGFNLSVDPILRIFTLTCWER